MRTLLAAIGLLLAGTASRGATVLYQDTFEPGDPIDYTAVVGAIVFGAPEIVGPQAPLLSQSAKFSTADAWVRMQAAHDLARARSRAGSIRVRRYRG